MSVIYQNEELINTSILRGEHKTTSWDDIIIPPSGLSRNNLAPDRELFMGSVEAPSFSGTSTEQLSGSFEIPHDYKEGTTLLPHIHWSPSDSTAGNVKWQLEYTIANGGEDYSTTTTIEAIGSTNSTDRKHYITGFSDIEGTGITIGAMCQFRLFRDGSDAEDTYSSDAFLLSIGVHYEQDGDGSRSVTTKE